jgi:capsular polysaccharide biosynthesis protein
MTPPDRPASTLDPEAEQEVDFARYGRLLAVRWWLLGAGLLAGALIGYGVSLGGSQVYSASSTIYLGQPYSASGNIQLQTLQTNPSSISAIVHSNLVVTTVAQACGAKAAQLRGNVATQSVAGNLARNGQNPVIRVTVKARKAKLAACAANGIAHKVVDKVSGYATRKVGNLRRQISDDEKSINTIKSALANSQVSTTDRLLFQLQLRTLQSDLIAADQLLVQAQQVEVPQVLTGAAAQRVTARSRRNTVVVAALIGLVIGALVALLWDRVAPRLAARGE